MSADGAVDIFFYGLFMDWNMLRQKGLKPQIPRLAKLEGYAIKIGERATIVPSKDSNVWGFVIGLTKPELDTLYSDQSVSAYHPATIEIMLEDDRVASAQCYILPDDDMSETNRTYASSLARLAARLKLPKDYVSRLRAIARQ